MEHMGIKIAHDNLVEAVANVTRDGFSPIAISIVSVSDGPNGQMVVFDDKKVGPKDIATRLRAAAEFLDKQ